jgi:hypothetical protein
MCWRFFGEHSLGTGEILGLLALSVVLITGYGLHAAHIAFPLLQLGLFHIRTFSASVSGSLFTRLGIGGVPFLLPLLYEVGLGFTPVQSGILIMPQALAAMSTKFLMPRILDWAGYRGVLISNTVILGLLLMLFATIGPATPLWLIVVQSFCYGAFTSLQYTSMNTLVYAGFPCPWRAHHPVHHRLLLFEERRRQQCEPATANRPAPGLTLATQLGRRGSRRTLEASCSHGRAGPNRRENSLPD